MESGITGPPIKGVMLYPPITSSGIGTGGLQVLRNKVELGVCLNTGMVLACVSIMDVM